jgi:hypothetical protein
MNPDAKKTTPLFILWAKSGAARPVDRIIGAVDRAVARHERIVEEEVAAGKRPADVPDLDRLYRAAQRPLEKLLCLIVDNDAATRNSAVFALGRLGALAPHAMRIGLHRTGDARLFMALVELLSSSGVEYRTSAMRVMQRIMDEDKDSYMRRELLGELLPEMQRWIDERRAESQAEPGARRGVQVHAAPEGVPRPAAGPIADPQAAPDASRVEWVKPAPEGARPTSAERIAAVRARQIAAGPVKK